MTLKMDFSPGFVTVILLIFGRTHGDSVSQTGGQVTISEGEFLTVNCTYSITGTAFPALFWYVQYPEENLQLLLKVLSAGAKGSSRGFEATYDKESTSFHLQKASVQESDSAVYYCALSGGAQVVGQLIWGNGTRLHVYPNIQDPKPAVYQLRDSRSKNSTICLFTDFDSQVNVSKDVSSAVFVSDKTVLNMRSMGSKSNGALAWSNQNDFDCKEAFRENASYPSSDVPCDAKLVEKSFETDMNLNFQNLSVMGLRILLLKVAGFNLFMTLRLWSN